MNSINIIKKSLIGCGTLWSAASRRRYAQPRQNISFESGVATPHSITYALHSPCNHGLTLRKPFLVFILLLFVPGCGNKELWPLEKGNYWEYGMRMKGNLIIARTRFEVISVRETGGEKIAEIEVKDPANQRLDSQFTLVSSSQGVYETDRKTFNQISEGYNETTTEYVPGTGKPYLIVPDAKPGGKWDFEYTLRNSAAGGDTGISGSAAVEGKQTFGTPIGRFKTIKVTQTLQRKGAIDTEYKSYWFQRGVGPVKMEVNNAAGDSVLMLVKAKVGRKIYGKKD